MRLIDFDALVDVLMTYTWRDEDERLIDDADEKREYIKQWLPDLPTVGGWISVNDRMPEQAGYRCLVAAKFIDGTYCMFTAFTGYGEPGWWTYENLFMEEAPNNKVHHDFKVTHWMPLPEPPKEEK